MDKKKEEFYAVIKLITGEEILSKVSPCEEEDRIVLILDSPVSFETIMLKNSNGGAIRVMPWLKISTENIIAINMDRVITIIEVHDKELIGVYERYLKDRERGSNQSNLNPNMGFLSSIADARVSFEKLYKSK